MRGAHLHLLLLAACTLSLAAVPSARAEERQYKIEAVFLYNFLEYITWPGRRTPEDMTQAVICIQGADPVQQYLEYIEHRKTQGHALTIRQLNNPDAMAGCTILFMRTADIAGLKRIRSLAAQNGVLLVSTTPGFVEGGGMIELVNDDERIAIAINNTALKEDNFQASSRLLSLAYKVE